jgi:hypothetical protein
MLGAGIVSGDAGFLGNALGWFVGFGLAIVFGVIAYLYYEVSVIIGMMGIGFALGTSIMVMLGVGWSWLIVLSGVVLAVVLAFVAIVGDLPMVLLTVLTALAGAGTGGASGSGMSAASPRPSAFRFAGPLTWRTAPSGRAP